MPRWLLTIWLLHFYDFQMLSSGTRGWRDRRRSRRTWNGSSSRATPFLNLLLLASATPPSWKSCPRRSLRHLSLISTTCTLAILLGAYS